jgi:SAM-dependent methyltransferase
MNSWEPDEINFGGERVTHLYPNDCYYAHLSIYRFALQFLQAGVVLDAGSGSGYGTVYLADHGAQFVLGLDVSNEATTFSRHYFTRPNLAFQTMDLQEISGLKPGSLDLIFSSNVLEHIPDAYRFFEQVERFLKPAGVLVLAVPPVVNMELQAHNLSNPFHLNIWSPRQWHHALSRDFAEIECYRHIGNRPDVVLDFTNTPAQTTIDETDFLIEPVSLDQLGYLPTLTVIFVARNPYPPEARPSTADRSAIIDDSFTLPLDDPAPRALIAAQLIHRAQGIERLLADIAAATAPAAPISRPSIAELEAIIAAKTSHIADLEDLIHRIHSGRLMRLLHWLNTMRSRFN